MEPWRLQIFDRLPSTQDVARDAAETGARRLAVLARTQDAGRGRNGRVWQGAPGNLFLSAIVETTDRPAGFWPLASAVALFDAVSPCVPAGALALRWPNDLLLHGAKLAGILIDASNAFAVIGIGLNIFAAPRLRERETAALVSVCHTPQSAEFIAGAILRRMDARAAQPFDAVRAAWLSRAHPVGTPLRVRSTSSACDRFGRFAGLASDGTLLLDDVPAPVAAGDVSFA